LQKLSRQFPQQITDRASGKKTSAAALVFAQEQKTLTAWQGRSAIHPTPLACVARAWVAASVGELAFHSF
jgi:hypothetical protein